MIFFKYLVLIFLLAPNTLLGGEWMGGHKKYAYTGIVPYYIDPSNKVYFLLGSYKSQPPSPMSLYCNFRGPGSTLDNAAIIGKDATKDFFWSVEDLKKALSSDSSYRIDTRSNYSFYLVDITKQVTYKYSGNMAAVAALAFGRPVIWIDAETYFNSVGHTGSHHTLDGQPISHFFFIRNDPRLTTSLNAIKKEYPSKKLRYALEILTEKLTELKVRLEMLT